jgi:heat shock protein HslJ
LVVTILAMGCAGDETLRAYGAAGKTWRLVELDDKPFAARATLVFPEQGKIAGLAPCNTYSATMSVPYPWFETGPIATTRTFCPDQAAETAFLAALAQMSLSEVLGNTLILSTPDGRIMLFKADA